MPTCRRSGAWVDLPYIAAINPHFARIDFIEAGNEVDQSRFSRSTPARDSHHLARRDCQVNVRQDRAGFVVAESDVVKLDFSAAMPYARSRCPSKGVRRAVP